MRKGNVSGALNLVKGDMVCVRVCVCVCVFVWRDVLTLNERGD